MTRETFVPKKFQAASLIVIEQANAIIAEYEALGFTYWARLAWPAEREGGAATDQSGSLDGRGGVQR